MLVSQLPPGHARGAPEVTVLPICTDSLYRLTVHAELQPNKPVVAFLQIGTHRSQSTPESVSGPPARVEVSRTTCNRSAMARDESD